METAFDPELMSMVFNNLLTNAIKYSPESGQIKVSLEKTEEGKHIRISVEDNGVGIEKNELTDIFEPFYRTKASEQAQIPGTGIGLAMVREIVNLLGGTIAVKSEINSGSLFTVVLPFQNPQTEFPDFKGIINPSSAAIVKENGVEHLQKEGPTNIENKPLVLLIEDHPEMHQYLADCLSEEFQLIQALNGEKGIEMALEHQPALIICDVMMPGKKGTEVCAELKQTEATRHIPVILLTAKADLASQKTGIQSGADLYLAKPFDEEQLLFWMKNILTRQELMAKVFSSPAWLAKRLSEPEPMEATDQAFLQNIFQFIQLNIQDPNLSVPQIAQAMNKGERTLHRDFKNLTGQTMKSYILELRVQLAKELLLTSNMSIEQISLEVGYNSLSAFSRAFKNHTGLSPAKYRELERI